MSLNQFIRCIMLLSLWGISSSVWAATLQVRIEGLQDKLLENAQASLSIYALNGKAAPDSSRLDWLHQQAVLELTQALQPFGYYQAQIDGQLVPDGSNWLARYTVKLGPAVKIRQAQIEVLGAGRGDPLYQQLLERSPLKPGAVLEHNAYEQFKSSLQALAVERGYFQAQLLERQVDVDLECNCADVRLRFDSGPRYQFGQVRFSAGPLSEQLLQRFVTLKPGEAYNTERLLMLQSDLLASDYFEQVSVSADLEQAQGETIPVVVTLQPRKRSLYSGGLGYGTDTGVRAKASIERRWVNEDGHKLKAETLVSGIKQNATLEYSIPGADPRSDSYSARFGLQAEKSDNKDSQTAVLGITHIEQWGNWRSTSALDYQWEQYTSDGEQRDTQLVMPSLQLRRTTTDNELKTREGYRVELQTRGSHSALLSDVSFAQAAVRSKWIVPVGSEDRLLLRGDLGTTWVNSQGEFERLPTSIRFYAGGDNSVRGYSLDSIGPRDSTGKVSGAQHLVVGSVEYEHAVSDNWGVAGFIDLGDAFNDQLELKTGVGVGVRWNSPVGPVRVDFASGLDEPGDSVRLHLSIGPDL